MKSACEHRAQMALELFEGEIMNIPHILTPNGVSLYHGNKADIAKRLNSEELSPEQDGKSAIILEMSPIIRAASCSTGIENFSAFAVIIYHHVAKILPSGNYSIYFRALYVITNVLVMPI